MKLNRHIIIGIMMVMLSVVISGCSAPANGPEPTPTAAPTTGATATPTTAPTVGAGTVIIQNFSYQPAEITIKKGESVTWTNKDAIKHNVASTTFTSELLGQGQSFTKTFNDVGTFDYHCTPHPYMTGKVIVTN